MVYRRGTSRIKGVRVTLAILLEIVAVIAGGGHAQTIQLDNLLCHAPFALRRLDGDPPGRTVRLAPFGLELAGDFHQVAAHPQLLQTRGDTIDRIPSGNTVEIDLDAITILAQLTVTNL